MHLERQKVKKKGWFHEDSNPHAKYHFFFVNSWGGEKHFICTNLMKHFICANLMIYRRCGVFVFKIVEQAMLLCDVNEANQNVEKFERYSAETKPVVFWINLVVLQICACWCPFCLAVIHHIIPSKRHESNIKLKQAENMDRKALNRQGKTMWSLGRFTKWNAA